MILPWSKEQNGEGSNDDAREEVKKSTIETILEEAKDRGQVRGASGWLSYRDYGQAKKLPRQKSNHKLFLIEYIIDHNNEVSGYHQGFHAHLSIRCDEGTDQDEPKLDRCFLLPIFERNPQTDNAGRRDKRDIPRDSSLGLVLLAQADGSYTRLGVYMCQGRCLGREAMENGMEQQIISIF